MGSGDAFMIGIIFLAVGVLVFCNPRGWYTLTESWKHEEGAEPSASFITSTKFGGCILIGIGVLGILSGIFL